MHISFAKAGSRMREKCRCIGLAEPLLPSASVTPLLAVVPSVEVCAIAPVAQSKLMAAAARSPLRDIGISGCFCEDAVFTAQQPHSCASYVHRKESCREPCRR